MRPFLTAAWRNLVLLTFAVDPVYLEPLVPKGLTLDLKDDHAFVSFVAFEFLRTRIRGIPIPFHINFPEINLRFYVRRKDQRGVMFIKELVPKHCIARIARDVYNEPYEQTPMKASSWMEEDQLIVEHKFIYKDSPGYLKFTAQNEPYFPEENSSAYFFKEHEWGFNTDKSGRLIRYKVEHPEWKIYPIHKRFQLEVDFNALYGEPWGMLNGKIPWSVILAEGSAVKVYAGEVIS